jgi:hypothetical protein
MENYYTDKRVLYALSQSSEEIDFEIKDNLGFDVLWDSLNGKQYSNVTIRIMFDQLRPEIKLKQKE